MPLHRPAPSWQNRDQGDTVFPDAYAESIASRAVVATNLHPNEKRTRAFRPVTKPRIYEMHKQRAANLSQLQQRLRLMTDLDTQSHPAATRDVLPYLKYFGGATPRFPGDGGAEKPTCSAPEDDIDEF